MRIFRSEQQDDTRESKWAEHYNTRNARRCAHIPFKEYSFFQLEIYTSKYKMLAFKLSLNIQFQHAFTALCYNFL